MIGADGSLPTACAHASSCATSLHAQQRSQCRNVVAQSQWLLAGARRLQSKGASRLALIACLSGYTKLAKCCVQTPCVVDSVKPPIARSHHTLYSPFDLIQTHSGIAALRLCNSAAGCSQQELGSLDHSVCSQRDLLLSRSHCMQVNHAEPVPAYGQQQVIVPMPPHPSYPQQWRM